MIWSKTFKLIEESLGFELYDWQKAYIAMDSDHIPDERQCGATTAFILRHLLNYGDKIGNYKTIGSESVEYWCAFPCDHMEFASVYKHDLYPRMVMDIDNKLRSVGINTCFI